MYPCAPCQMRQLKGLWGTALHLELQLHWHQRQLAGCLPPGQTSETHCKATTVEQLFNPRLHVVQLKKSPSTNFRGARGSLSDGECYLYPEPSLRKFNSHPHFYPSSCGCRLWSSTGFWKTNITNLKNWAWWVRKKIKTWLCSDKY